MKNNIISKKLCKKALIAFVCCSLFFMSLLIFSCTPLDDTSIDVNTDSSTNDALESETEENLTAEEETTLEEETSTEEETAEEDAEEEQPEEQAEAEEITINVYYSDQMAEYLVPESRIISSENKYVDTLYELMKKPIDSSLTPLVPDTAIINSITIEEGNAKVDLSQEFLDDRFISDTVDILLIYSIVNTLTQFSEINSVTLYIEGEKLDILGQLDVTEPVFRRNDLIKNN
ncbi:hypothetical protein ES708_27465 [subsurface metagenome]